MKKNLLLTFIAALLFSASFSQKTAIDLAAKLIAPKADTVHSDKIQFQLRAYNNGPVAMNTGDTLFYGVYINGNLAYSNGAIIPSTGFPVGDSLNFNPVTLTTTTHPTTPKFDQVCVVLFPQPSSYVDTSAATRTNNFDCYTWSRSIVSLSENTLKEEVKVYVSYSTLKLSATTNESLSYSVVSITGQVISQGKFTSNKDVDLSNAAKGMYAVIISNGTEKTTKKVVVQ